MPDGEKATNASMEAHNETSVSNLAEQRSAESDSIAPPPSFESGRLEECFINFWRSHRRVDLGSKTSSGGRNKASSKPWVGGHGGVNPSNQTCLSTAGRHAMTVAMNISLVSVSSVTLLKLA